MIPTIMPQINLDRILLNYLYPKNRTIFSPFYTDGNIKKNFAEMGKLKLNIYLLYMPPKAKSRRRAPAKKRTVMSRTAVRHSPSPTAGPLKLVAGRYVLIVNPGPRNATGKGKYAMVVEYNDDEAILRLPLGDGRDQLMHVYRATSTLAPGPKPKGKDYPSVSGKLYDGFSRDEIAQFRLSGNKRR